MRFAFSRLPNESVARPVITVGFADFPGVSIPALMDTGAVGVRFPGKLASLLELDLTQGYLTSFSAAGKDFQGYVLDVELRLQNQTWICPVTFVEGWEFEHALLGLRGFFDEWDVRFFGRRQYATCQRSRNPMSRSARRSGPPS